MGWWWKRSRRSIPYNVTTDVELKIGMHCEKCAKKIRKVVSKLEGVQECITDMRNQKVMVAGNFDLERMLKIIKKKTGKNAEILVMTKKSDVVQKEDDESDIVQTDDGHEIVLEKNEKSSLVQKKQEIPENKESDDKRETSVMEVEFRIPFLCDKYEVNIGKVISKFEGVNTCVVDIENQKVLVTGNFDQEKLLKKLKKNIHKKKDEESKISAEKKEETDLNRDMHVQPPDSDDENEMAKYMIFSDANPNGCSIS